MRQQLEQVQNDDKGLGAADVKANAVDAAAASSVLQQQSRGMPQQDIPPHRTWASSVAVGDSVNELPTAGQLIRFPVTGLT